MPQTPNTQSLILIGDSIFDNAVYVAPNERCVEDHCRALLPDWNVRLWAVDGNTASDIPSQIESHETPPDAVAVMSVGGNDALAYQELLLGDMPPIVPTNLFAHLHPSIEQFRAVYNKALDAIQARNIPLSTCTIYNGNFPEPQQAAATTGIALFNDVIYRESGRRNLPVIELRDVCTDLVHYANPIEPSESGGLAIAEAITAIHGTNDGTAAQEGTEDADG